MKLPSFQFYPGDWRKDPAIQSLSLEQRGAWLELLCLMHECEPRGYLMLNGKPFPEDSLARLLNIPAEDLLNQNGTTHIRHILTLFVERGVASIDPDTKAIFCRRMVRDEKLRQTRASCGKLGGNPALLNQNGTTPGGQKATPSSSSSSSDTIAPAAPRHERERNVLFDALAIAEGSDPKQLTGAAAKKIGVALAQIKAAMPNIQPSDIQSRARAYKRMFPTAALTAHALQMHWAKLDSNTRSEPNILEIPEPPGWMAFLNTEWPDSRFSAHQKDEAHVWSDLDRATQKLLTARMRESGVL